MTRNIHAPGLLFLDFDGVLVFGPPRHLESGQPWKGGDNPPAYWAQFFNPVAVANLNTLLLEENLHIVVSSHWQYGRTLDALGAILAAAGVSGVLEGRTLDAEPERVSRGGLILAAPRWQEIKQWLRRFEARTNQTPRFLILDDCDVSEGHRETEGLRGECPPENTFLQLSFDKGLTETDVQTARAMLRRQTEGSKP